MYMKKFTVKDFITYNNPCFSCSNKVSIKIGVVGTASHNDIIYLSPTVSVESTNIVLKITYTSSLKLKIFNKSNKAQTTSVQDLTKYLQEHGLFLRNYMSYFRSSTWIIQ